MEQVEVGLLTPGGNNAVVQMPGRKFPGVLVQGDTMSSLLALAEAAESLLQQGDTQRGAEEVADLANSLAEMLTGYEAALAQHGIRRPYSGTFRRLPNDD